MTGFLCLLPLAITSTKGWVKRLGARRWQKLHHLVYLAGAAGCIHFAMLVKGNQTAPKVYLSILAVLLAARYMPARKRRAAATSQPRSFAGLDPGTMNTRSEEHTSELQSLMRISYA